MNEPRCQLHDWNDGHCDLPATHVKIMEGDGVFGWRCARHAAEEERDGVLIFALDEVPGKPVDFWHWDMEAIRAARR